MKTYSRLDPELTEVLSQGTYNLHGDIGNAGFMTFRLESFRTCGLSQEAMNFSSLFSVSTVYLDILCSGSFFLGIRRKSLPAPAADVSIHQNVFRMFCSGQGQTLPRSPLSGRWSAPISRLNCQGLELRCCWRVVCLMQCIPKHYWILDSMM